MPLLRTCTLATSLAALLTVPATAQGDECSNALPVTVGTYGPFDSTSATTSQPAWGCASGGNDLWFVALANANGSATFDTCGSGFDTCIEVFDGTAGCTNLTSIACNDDSCGTRSSATVAVTAGQQLYVRVGGWNSRAGAFVLNVSGDIGPETSLATALDYGAGCYQERATFYEHINDPANFDLSMSSFTMLATGTGRLHGHRGYRAVRAADAERRQPRHGRRHAVDADADDAVPARGHDALVAGRLLQRLRRDGFEQRDARHDRHQQLLRRARRRVAQLARLRSVDRRPGHLRGDRHDGLLHVDRRPGLERAGQHEHVPVPVRLGDGERDLRVRADEPHGSGGGGNGHIVGYSPGGISLRPAELDLSTALLASISVDAADGQELTLSADARPLLGSSINVVTLDVPATAALGVQIFGLNQVNPGTDLAAFGMAGCRQYLSTDASGILVPVGGTASWPVNTPTSATFAGVAIFAQSLMLVPGRQPVRRPHEQRVTLRFDVN